MTAQQQRSREKAGPKHQHHVDRYNKTIYQAGDGWTFVKAEEEVTTTT